jgi:outer membrane cobalamin receptor
MQLQSPCFPVLAVALFLSLAPASLVAQSQPTGGADDPTRFNTDIVVTPERGATPRVQVPASTVVLDAETLKTQPAVSLGEALSFLPGFEIERSAFHAGVPLVSARGFFGGGEADYVLLLVDGVPMADAESGLVDWSVISLSSIRRIEGFRGPGASMYGDAAVGGVIQVLTSRNGQGSELNTTAGGFGTLTVDGAHRRRFKRTTADFAGMFRRTAGISDHSEARYISGTAGLDGRVGQSTWRLTGNGNRRSNEDPGALTLDLARQDPRASDPLSRFDEVQRHAFAGAFTLQRSPGAWGHQERVYVNTRDEDQTRTILLIPGFGDRQTRALSTRAVGASAEGERRLGSGAQAAVIRFGVDLSRQHLETSYRPVDDDGIAGVEGAVVTGRRLRVGTFASSSWNPVSRLRLSGAVRWDGVDDSSFEPSSAPNSVAAGDAHQAWSPRLGVTVALSDARPVWLFSQVSKAFKVPTLNQLFDPRPYPDFNGGSLTISNRGLVPQRATNIEVGVQGGDARLRWSALAYRVHVENEIDFDARTFSYANIGESRHTGVEVEVGGRVWQRLQPSIRYVLTAVGPVDADRQLKNVPRHTVILATQIDLPAGLAGTLRYRHTAGAFLDDENAIAIHGPSTLDLRLRRGFGRHQLFIDVVNLTDDRYEEYGFTLSDIEGGLTPFAYPGAPRAVRAGFTLGF